MKWSQKKLEEIYRKAMKRSMTDEAFRKKLQADSASALAEIAGEDLPNYQIGRASCRERV